jgi:hypothetical protein
MMRSAGIGPVDCWVEGGVVVHLELAVDFEAAAPLEDVGPELVEAGDEIIALLGEEGEAGTIALSMALGGVRAIDFFLGVGDFEGENGEAVDDEAGGFGIERGRWGGATLRAEKLGGLMEELDVALFGEVVTALVAAIDCPFDLGNVVVGGAGVAGTVFGMPEVEVGTVLIEDGVEEVVGVDVVGIFVAVPESGGAVVETGYFESGKVEGVGHGIPVPMVEQRRGFRV